MTFFPDMALDVGSVGTVLPWLAAALLTLICVRRLSGPALSRSRHILLWLCRAGVLAVLVAIGLNPVRVSVTPTPIHRPEVHVLLDASQSMRLGSPESRWIEATSLLRSALDRQDGHVDVRIHRFGERLVPVDLAAFRSGSAFGGPDDADTQLASAFRQLYGRFGRDAPANVVVISDGRVRDPEKLEELAGAWRKLHVPVHVVPVGRAVSGGDVAIVAAVAPARARKQAQVTVDVFLRSFGFTGRRVELQLQAMGENGTVRRTLKSLPVTLQDGVQPITMAFRSEPDVKVMRLHVNPLPGDLAPSNNDFPLEIELDRTKIRVLLLDGSADLAPRQARVEGEPIEDSDAPYAPLRDALTADPDVQCTVYSVASGEPRRMLTRETAHLGPAFPKTAAELLAYDALVLSNVPRTALSDEILAWVDEWIGKRGGGLLMAGGPRSFGAGGWNGTVIERILPVEFTDSSDWDGSPAVLEPTGADLHPVWKLFEDERATRAALKLLPESQGRNNWVRVKPQSGSLLGAQRSDGIAPAPLLAVGAYGRGRAAALATPISAPWSPAFTRQWGEGGDNRHFAKFVRNAIYWLTEESAIGRRRLVAETDKRYYRPGETIALSAHTFDEAANRTGRYRIEAILEPKQLDAKLPAFPVKLPAKSGMSLGWGDPFELHPDPQTKEHTLPLPLVEVLEDGTSGLAFKLELTAYEGGTQIDSSSVDVQILSDPHERQNPLPNREFLANLAKATGGREFTDSASLADAWKELAIVEGPQIVHRMPLWSRDWLLGVLIGFLAVEWFSRRWLGLG
ncbi:MAG TPA: glutamine amidotransferase [Urbifossiella sp.]